METQGCPKLSDALRFTRAKLVARALEEAEGNVTVAAKILDVHRNSMHVLIRLAVEEGVKLPAMVERRRRPRIKV